MARDWRADFDVAFWGVREAVRAYEEAEAGGHGRVVMGMLLDGVRGAEHDLDELLTEARRAK